MSFASSLNAGNSSATVSNQGPKDANMFRNPAIVDGLYVLIGSIISTFGHEKFASLVSIAMMFSATGWTGGGAGASASGAPGVDASSGAVALVASSAPGGQSPSAPRRHVHSPSPTAHCLVVPFSRSWPSASSQSPWPVAGVVIE